MVRTEDAKRGIEAFVKKQKMVFNGK
jgi:hypothetical protein